MKKVILKTVQLYTDNNYGWGPSPPILFSGILIILNASIFLNIILDHVLFPQYLIIKLINLVKVINLFNKKMYIKPYILIL